MRQEDADREALRLAADGAQFFASHSGGKDSLAMYRRLLELGIPAEQITLVHADLGAAEWPGTIQHIRENTQHELNIVTADVDFLAMVEERHVKRPDAPPWPSPKYRQCTARLKRQPIGAFIKRWLDDRPGTVGVNVTGERAGESKSRAALPAWGVNKHWNATARKNRAVFDYRPVHDWSEKKVKGYILANGMKLGHAYETGNDRMSCRFCIMGCPSDLANAARQYPELLAQYEELEQRTGYTMFHGMSLRQKVAKARFDAFGKVAKATPAQITHTEQLKLL